MRMFILVGCLAALCACHPSSDPFNQNAKAASKTEEAKAQLVISLCQATKDPNHIVDHGDWSKMTNTQKAEADKIAAEELECISEILNKTVPKTAALPMCQDFGGGIIGGFLQGQQAKEGCTPAGPGYADRDSHAAVAEQLERLREQMQLWQGQQFVLQSQQNFWDMVGAMNGR